MERALFVKYWKAVARMGAVAWPFYKFSPPRVETNSCSGEGGQSWKSQGMWECQGCSRDTYQIIAQRWVRCCLASRHKLKLVSAEHWPERQSLRHSLATARVEERAVGLVLGGAGRAEEF